MITAAPLPAFLHCPFTHWQALISSKPQIEAMPCFAHCALTAAGSVLAFLFTHIGKRPQQLPTSLTAQSLSTLQRRSGALGSKPEALSASASLVFSAAEGGAAGAGGVVAGAAAVGAVAAAGVCVGDGVVGTGCVVAAVGVCTAAVDGDGCADGGDGVSGDCAAQPANRHALSKPAQNKRTCTRILIVSFVNSIYQHVIPSVARKLMFGFYIDSTHR